MQNVLKQFGAKDTGSSSSSSSFDARYARSLIRLTLLYTGTLAVILFVSGAISFTTFSSRISRRFDHMPPPGTIIIREVPENPLPFHTPTAAEVRADFILSLIVVNASLLVLAGILSYLLARMTLRPIKKAYDDQQQFLANASHELRTPLSILQLDLENELAGPKLSGTTKERARSNLEEVERMTRIVGDLLQLSRMDEGAPDMLARTDITIDHLLARVASHLGALATSQSVELSIVKNEQAITVHGHEDVLFQALGNVVKNAILYNTPGGTVTLSAHADSKKVFLVIKDTGVGIAPEHLPKIFDRFYRVDEHRTRSTGGSGLGLSIVRTSVERLGGFVAIESEPGKGTTVTVTLPRS